MSAESTAAGPAATYKVTAIRYGALDSTLGVLFHHWGYYGEPDAEAEMAYYFWLLQSPDRTVLVDTGFDPAAGVRRGRRVLVEPLTALARIGVEPEEVSTVLVSHFHYDHVGNLGAFPHAELIVGRTELDFWTGTMARRALFAAHVEAPEIARIERAVEEGRVRTTAGDEEVLPGIRAIEVGGHSPGQLMVEVAGTDGPVLLTSDAVHFYEELELDRPFGVVADLAAMYRAYDTLREREEQGVTLVAGHDPAVMDRFPAANADAGLAVEIKGRREEQ